MTRIAIAGFQHETNTFGATLAGFAEFEEADAWPPLLVGDDVITGTSGINLPINGFVEAARAAGDCTVIPVSWCSAEPSSFVTTDAFERIAAMILSGIEAAGAIDGVYLDLHGAMVTEEHEDGEGELLARLRRLIGPDLPVAISLDLHANLTEAIVEHASSISIFRTYPHIDMAEAGARAFAALMRMVAGERFHRAFRQAPYLVPLTGQYTGASPCRELYAGLDTLVNPAVIDADLAMGFPAADIRDAGPAIVTHAPSRDQAEAAADVLLQSLVDAESQFTDELMQPDACVVEAMRHDGPGPVVIADAQDNPGAGGTSDTTGLLRALVELEAQGAVLALMNDPDVAAQAHELGEGAEFEADLGGKSGLAGQQPYPARYRVEALGDGRFAFTGEMYAGAEADLGPTAVLRVLDTNADVRVVVGSKRCQCLDQALFTHIGIDPRRQRIVGVKSTVHFRADYEPIADKVLVVEAPGAHPCRLDVVTYRNLRPGVRLGPGGQPFSP